jgi:hypothetical protein
MRLFRSKMVAKHGARPYHNAHVRGYQGDIRAAAAAMK